MLLFLCSIVGCAVYWKLGGGLQSEEIVLDVICVTLSRQIYSPKLPHFYLPMRAHASVLLLKINSVKSIHCKSCH